MIKKLNYIIIALVLLLSPTFVHSQSPPSLGAASSFALFTAVGAFNNVGGGTTVTGDVGTNAGAFNAFPPGTLIGSIHVADPTSAQAATDVGTAYSYLSGVTCGPVLGVGLGGGQVLTPNVYCIGAAATITGSLVLDGQGNPNSLFIIKINGALAAAASSSVVLINGASICNVFWQINGQFTLGAGAIFRGTALVNGAIDFSAGGAQLYGRALAIAGAISLKNAIVTIGLQPTASTITASGSTTFCAGGNVVLSGNIGGTWSNGGSTLTKTITTSGTYYVTNTSLCGTVTSNSITVTVVPNPTIAVNSGTICSGNSITLTATGGTTYSWSPGTGLNSTSGNSVIANPTLTTVYTVTGTTSGCSSTKTSTVTVKPLPTATIAASGPITFCQGGSVTLTASNGTSYLWSTSAITQSIAVTTPGNYSVVVTGTNGCSATSSVITVVVNPLPTITVNNGVICNGGSTTLTASGANTYTWSPPTGLNATTGATVIANPTVTTTYTITGTSVAGCVNSTTASVTVVPSLTVTVNSGTICAGSSITLTANGANTYSWGPGTGLNSTTGTSVIANPTTTTIYTVTGTAGSCSITQTSTVTVNPLPTATIAASGPITFCQGGSVTLTASSGTSYLWSTSATTQSINVTSSGNYSVTVTDANGCSATSTVTTVLVNPLPTITANSATICAGGSVTLTASGANTYTWSPPTGLSTTIGASVIANPTVTTTYTITGTSVAGCINTTTSSVTVFPGVTLTVNSGTICAGNSITLTANGANTYSWGPGTGLNSTTGTSVIANPTITTVYTVTGTVGSCSATQTSTVTVNPLPTATIAASGPTTFCQGGSVTLTASSGTSYLWSTSATSQSIAVTTSGNYSVTVTDGNGCSATSSITTIVVNPLPTITVNNGVICNGGSATLTASGANTYTWSPPTGLNTTTGATVIANPTVTTTYTITGTSVAGCVNSTTASVTVSPSLTLTVNSGTICAGNSITLTANGANTYSWGPGTGLNSTTGTSVIANPTTTIVYTVTGTAGSCSATQTSSVTVNPLPTATIGVNGSTTFCQGGSVTLTASSGTSYLWSTSATTQSIIVTTSGNYSVTVTSANGCSATSSVTTVVVNPLPTITVNSATMCAGGSVTLIANGANTYTWSPPTGLNTTTGATVIANPTVTTTYTVTGTSVAGCVNTTTASVTVVPSLTLTVNSATICVGNSVTLTANGANTYSWGPGTGLNSTTGTSVIANPTITTVYTVTGTAGSCSTTQTSTVTVNPLPTSTIGVNGSTTFCQGGSATLTASNGTSYLWSNAATSQSIIVSTSGNYSVTVTNANGCSATSSIITVVVNPLPTITVNNGVICNGGSATLIASGANTYTWSPPTGLNTTTGATVIANPTVTTIYTITGTSAAGCINTATTSVTVALSLTLTVNSATICVGNSVTLTANGANTYSWGPGTGLNSTAGTTVIANPTITTVYTVTGTAGSCSATQTSSVTVNPLPTATIGVNGSTTFCQGGSATLTASSGTSYLWSNAATTQSIVVTTGGNYSVTVTNANGCSATSSIVTIVVNPLPTITANSGIICPGGSVTLTANGANTYTWSPPAGLNTTTGASVIASPTVTTIYTITGTSVAGCVNNTTASVTVVNNLTITVNSGTICAGNSVTLTANGANTYSWGPGIGLNSTTGSSVIANPTLTTVYTVTGTAGNCSGIQTTTVTVNPLPTATISASGPTTFCQGGSVTLTSSGGASYLWSNAATTQSIVVTTSGNYSVTVTNANGCSATSSVITVVVNPLPTATIATSGPTTICQGDYVILTSSPGSSYLWSNSATTQSIIVSNAGNYSVTVTGANGCTATSSVTTVIVNFLPTASVAVNGPTVFCQGGSTTLTASGGVSYLWSNNATTQSITVTTGGNYSVTVTSASGCTATSGVVTISVNPSPTVNLGADTTVCGCILLNAYNPGASYNWNTGQDYSMINVCSSGKYWVSVSNGICITTDTIKVIVHPKPVVNISMITGTVTTLDAGNAGSTFLWNTGATTQTIIAANSGIYYVDVTNQYGCKGSDTIMVGFAGIAKNNISSFPLKIYPNPSYDKSFTLNFEMVDRRDVEIRIVNILGMVVYDEKLENFMGTYNKKLELQNSAKGIYFAEVKSGAKRSVIKIALE